MKKLILQYEIYAFKFEKLSFVLSVQFNLMDKLNVMTSNEIYLTT